MKKLNKQILIDLEKKSKQLRLLDKTNIHEFTKALVDFQEYLEAITTSIDKELEKYGYCEKCGSYHNIDPLEAGNVGCSQSQFAAALHDEQTVGELLLCHHSLDDGGCAVRRTVVDDQNVETFFQPEDGADDFLDVLLLVIRRDNDDTVASMHSFCRIIL